MTQNLTSEKKIDQWFDLKTKGLSDLARAQLRQKWGTMRKVTSSRDRIDKIVDDILIDMETRDRLMSGRGNAMLVSDSVYAACRFFEAFSGTELKGRCAIVTSYSPATRDIKGEETGEGVTEKLLKYDVYRKMLADHFGEPEDKAMHKADQFERQVKRRFVNDPGQMKLLIVVDKLLTGFDAPPATYLYIDKKMQDHGLFQAICRVNRLDGDDKEYGYIIDYKDLFRSLEGAIQDYTGEAFANYDREDVEGLLKDRLEQGRKRLEETREAVKALCEPVERPYDTDAYLHYFCQGGGRRLCQAARRQRTEAPHAVQNGGGVPARLREPGQRDDRGRLHRDRTARDPGRGQPLREGAPGGEAGERRLRRPQGVRARHAPAARQLHPGRGQQNRVQVR